mgnify:CR=1 FL=1
MSNIFFAGLKISPAPWHIERLNGSGPTPTDIIRDRDGTHIMSFEYPQGAAYTPHQYRANRQMVENAPKLLAALVEYAYNLDTTGIGVTQELADLIIESGGPDITSRVKTVDKDKE